MRNVGGLLAASVLLLACFAVIWARFGVAGTPVSPLLLPVADVNQVLDLIAAGKRVVFIDAREPEEFQERRIPSAINLTLREVRDLDARLLGQPDLVIAYCLKDFRGFEVARALSEAGVPNVATLKQAGINGWLSAGLPVASGDSSEPAAIEALEQCARDRPSCANAMVGAAL